MAEQLIETTSYTVETIMKMSQTNPPQLTLPKYQRRIVWDTQQKKDLITSLQKRWPVGALLIHKETFVSTDEPQTDLVIDGLQRISTILEHVKTPFEYGSVTTVHEDNPDLRHHLDELLKGLKETWDLELEEGKLLDVIDQYLKGCVDFSNDDFGDPFVFTRGFAEVLKKTHKNPEIPESEAPAEDFDNAWLPIGSPGQKICKIVRDRLDITQIKIPVLEYRGTGENLEKIFELLNAKGTVLSDYDIYAARWYRNMVKNVDPRIKEAAKKKYDELLASGDFTIDGYSQGDEIEELNLYEYLLGLGPLMTQNSDNLFQSVKEGDVLKNAFQITTLAHGLGIGELGNLNQALPVDDDGKIDLSNFTSALLGTIEWVDTVFAGIGGFKFNNFDNKKIKNNRLKHADFLINSIVVSVLFHFYDQQNNWQERPDYKKRKKSLNLKKQILRLYVHDVVKSFWKGSLNTYILDRLWEKDKNSENMVKGDILTRVERLTPNPPGYPFPDDQQIKNVLTDYYLTNLQINSSKRKIPEYPGVLLLRIIYMNLITAGEEKTNDFHLDHTIPVDFLNRSKRDEGWPINHWANLSLVSADLNLKKEAMTSFEFKDHASSKKFRTELETSMLADFSHYQNEVGDALFDTDFAKDVYMTYLDVRYEIMEEKILEELKLG